MKTCIKDEEHFDTNLQPLWASEKHSKSNFYKALPNAGGSL